MHMAYKLVSTLLGTPSITDTSTTQALPLGTLVRAVDDTYGEGGFVYLKGVASTAVGSVVIFDQKAGTTTLATAGSRGPVAVAMSANVASQYGWYQVQGSAVVKASTVAANGNVYATAAAATVDDATVAGDKVDGARFKSADGTPSAGFAVAQLAFPSMNGNG
jgi:hypothetical protein